MLTDSQRQHFLDNHYIALEDCFDAAIAREWVADAFKRGGVDPDRPETYPESFSFFGQKSGTRRVVDVREFSPKVWDACCDLVGGADRIDDPYLWADSFIVNFSAGDKSPWRPPDHTRGSWHIDGDFQHYLDSPEIGLFVIAVWKDIAPRGGGTAVALDSVGPVARRILAPPGGLPASRFKDTLNQQCTRFMQIEGRAGTVFLMHPFMLHSVTQNQSGTPRVITNPHPSLREPMRLDRADPRDFSLVELATLRALGTTRIEYASPVCSRRFATDHDNGLPRAVAYGASREARLQRLRDAATAR